jgi:hypothetical protein
MAEVKREAARHKIELLILTTAEAIKALRKRRRAPTPSCRSPADSACACRSQVCRETALKHQRGMAMSDRENLAVVQRWFDAVNAQDPDPFAELLDERYVWDAGSTSGSGSGCDGGLALAVHSCRRRCYPGRRDSVFSKLTHYHFSFDSGKDASYSPSGLKAKNPTYRPVVGPKTQGGRHALSFCLRRRGAFPFPRVRVWTRVRHSRIQR